MLIFQEHVFEGVEYVSVTSSEGKYVIHNGFEYGTVWVRKNELQPCSEGDVIPDGIDEAEAYDIIFGGGEA